MNIFGNYNHNKSHNESFINIYRKQLDTLFDQPSVNEFRSNSDGFKAGLDYFASSRSTDGIMVNGNFSDFNFDITSRTPISYNEVVDRILQADNTNKNRLVSRIGK